MGKFCCLYDYLIGGIVLLYAGNIPTTSTTRAEAVAINPEQLTPDSQVQLVRIMCRLIYPSIKFLWKL